MNREKHPREIALEIEVKALRREITELRGKVSDLRGNERAWRQDVIRFLHTETIQQTAYKDRYERLAKQYDELYDAMQTHGITNAAP